MSRIFRENSWNNFKGLSEFLNSVLVKAWLFLGELLDLVCDEELGGTSTWDQAVISDKRFDGIDTIVNSALDVVKLSVSGATEYDSCHFVLLLVPTENGTPSAGDFLEADLISVSHLIGGRALQFDDWDGTTGFTNSLEFPFGHNLYCHHLIFFEEMDSKFGH